MPVPSRRAVVTGVSAIGAALSLAGCVTTAPWPQGGSFEQYGSMYGPIDGDRFPIPALKFSEVAPAYLRKEVDYVTREAPGTIVVDPSQRYLYFVEKGGRAVRYGVGVGGEGFGWSGVATVKSKQEWPDWYPPDEMLERKPELLKEITALRSGFGMPGGPRSPIGARALYLWQGNKDTLYRIHGTNEPGSIGRSASSGCIRMINQDVIDLYRRTPIGTKVVVLASHIGVAHRLGSL
jgi:lipoprotein-anchoring transpeptidase ErfK/SrfK